MSKTLKPRSYQSEALDSINEALKGHTIVGVKGRPRATDLRNGRPSISVSDRGLPRRFTVARIVCETFHGPCPDRMQAAHEDGDVLNSRADNLSWKTPKENSADRDRHGTTARGERQGAARLTEDQVREMRTLHAAGTHSMSALAGLFGVAKGTVSWVVSRRSWAHIA